jgi:hypothetical protein
MVVAYSFKHWHSKWNKVIYKSKEQPEAVFYTTWSKGTECNRLFAVTRLVGDKPSSRLRAL